MKKLLIASCTSLILSLSATSFASINDHEAAYLFGTQSAIEIQVLSNTEMAATEGQLFGITMETTSYYAGLAYNALKPYLSKIFNQLKDSALNAIKARFNTPFTVLPPIPNVIPAPVTPQQ